MYRWVLTGLDDDGKRRSRSRVGSGHGRSGYALQQARSNQGRTPAFTGGPWSDHGKNGDEPGDDRHTRQNSQNGSGGPLAIAAPRPLGGQLDKAEQGPALDPLMVATRRALPLVCDRDGVCPTHLEAVLSITTGEVHILEVEKDALVEAAQVKELGPTDHKGGT